MLYFKRLGSKSDLLLDLLKKKNDMTPNETDPNDSNQTISLTNESLVIEKQAFIAELFILLANIKLICNKFDYVLNTCDNKVYYSIGGLFYDFNLYEKNLDVFFELLQKDQLDENISLELLEKACVHLQVH